MNDAQANDPHQLRPLLSRVLTGERRALESLLETLRPYLHLLVAQQNAAFGRCRKLGDSDLVQESLLRIHGGLDPAKHGTKAHFRADGVGPFLCWVGEIVRNLHADMRDREFVTALRGTLNLLFADSLTLRKTAEPLPAAVELKLIVSRQIGDRNFLPVAATQPHSERSVRDLKRVPPSPDRICLRTGDRVRIEVETTSDGFVTVFNIGPTGNLN
jgi:DNA-directed RNA polymerase specialized sigma24 family protein